MVILLIFALFMHSQVSAKNFGVFGETFSIDEPDFIEQIQTKLGELQQNGKLEAAQSKIQKQVVETLKHPAPVNGIIHTETPRTFEFDPTVQLTRDLQDHNGRIFAKKGEHFNPLDYIQMTKVILFFDGDDENHLQWALSKPQPKCLIPVKGSPLELQKRFGQPVYFDQRGTLISKLGIKQVPAMVQQNKRNLLITEEKPCKN
jgi:conjugal transfer pilus assembly protein TraW